MSAPSVPVTSALDAVAQAVTAKKLSAAAGENIRRWLTADGYRAYVPRLLELIRAAKFEELDGLFWEIIPFGTGGRRGTMAELGSATINDRTIAESANGLATYLRKVRGAPGGKVALAYDTRHRSRDFAKITAVTLAAHGLKVYLFDSHRATPELSFAVRYLGCDVGAMISASHNPPADNGFKAYWSHGGQVLPPHDKGIIDCVYESDEIPTVDFDAAVKSGQIEMIGEAIDDVFLKEVSSLSLSSARDLPGLFTPLHGVGETSVYRVLQQAGFAGVSIFEPQRNADGAFPNVPNHLPNPELTAVFGPAIEQAKNDKTEIILASDPDADRIGVAVRDKSGEFVHISGNRIGALVVDYVLRKRKAAGTLSPQHYVVETLVTTPLVSTIAKAAGVRAIDDLLVGFKYIGQVVDREGPEGFVFGAEESLGYLAGNYARDKDAAIAALYVCELAAELRQQGKSLLDRLDELFEEHGYFLESQRSETCKGPKGRAMIVKLMQEFAEHPPKELGGLQLSKVRDYVRHEVRSLPDNKRSGDLPEPQGDMLIFETRSPNCAVTLAARPSGTEPKIKFYFFARAERSPGDTLAVVKERTAKTLRDFENALSAWAQGVFASE